PGCADDYVFRPREIVHYADYLALTDRRPVTKREQALSLRIPLPLQAGDARRVVVAHSIALMPCVQLLQRNSGVRNKRERCMLVSIHCRDVDVYEAHIRILKRGLRSVGEIAQPRADRNHKIGFASENV